MEDKTFPCVGAKSALNRNRIRFGQYTALAEARSVQELCADLAAFSEEFKDPGEEPVSFVATFSQSSIDSEAAFEQALWNHLQAMHLHDGRLHQWDAAVSSDPNSPDFSFSVGGRAYFVVGLHPQASRMGRRAPMVTLVFNFHNQFEALRESGKYEVLQAAIRKRDVALQGSVNPVLARFGESSEARQYSGRATPANWKCPFHADHATQARHSKGTA